jgi:hypothetical protein
LKNDSKPVYQTVQTIAVPSEIYDWKASPSTRVRALEIEERNRNLFLQAFSAGLSVLGYEHDASGNGKFLLGYWDEPWKYDG